MQLPRPLILLLLTFGLQVGAINFPYESRQLTDQDIGTWSAISFGDVSSAPSVYKGPKCKVLPEDAAWPNKEQWDQLNATVSGNLLKPYPVGAACYLDRPEYNETTCAYLVGAATTTRFFFSDPLTSLTTWGEGATCLQLLNTTGRTCQQGGFPVYVVNTSSVRDIQAGVNFARSQNLRLVIK